MSAHDQGGRKGQELETYLLNRVGRLSLGFLSTHRRSVGIDRTVVLVLLGILCVLVLLLVLAFLSIERFCSRLELKFRSLRRRSSGFGFVAATGEESEGVDRGRGSGSFCLGLLLVRVGTSRAEREARRISLLADSSETTEVSSLGRSLRLGCPSIGTGLGDTKVAALSSPRVGSRELITETGKLASGGSCSSCRLFCLLLSLLRKRMGVSNYLSMKWETSSYIGVNLGDSLGSGSGLLRGPSGSSKVDNILEEQ